MCRTGLEVRGCWEISRATVACGSSPALTVHVKTDGSVSGGFLHTRVEELLHDFALSCREALVQVPHAVGQSLFQGRVIEFFQKWSQVLLSAVQEPAKISFCNNRTHPAYVKTELLEQR